MPRMSVPMRVRRRQSDAKWRASVATCYDTLKHIIPNNEKMSKRKISKALILQQTEKHIENLENTLRDLLGKKARSKNKVVLYDNKLGMVEANLDDVKSDFSYRQKPLYYQSSMQRKKSSIPSDVETGLVNLRSTICNLSVLPVEILQQQMVPKVQTDQADSEVTMATSNIPVEESDKNVPVIHINEGGHPQVLNTGPSVIVLNVDDHNNIQSMNVEETAPYFSTMESLLKTPVKSRNTAVKTKKRGRLTMNSIIGENLMDKEELPVHSEQHITITPLKDKPVQITPKQRGKDSNKKIVTPKRRVKQSPYVEGGNTTAGFTPIKLPDNIVFDTPSKLQESVESPMFHSWSFVGTPGGSSDKCVDDGEFDSEEIDVASLLCTEDINQMDLGDEDISDHEDYRTPYNQERRLKIKQEKIIKDRKQRKTTLSPPEYDEKRTVIPGSNCRRQLEKCFSKGETALPVINGVFQSTDNGCLDFDGYFLFYQHVANEEKEIKSVDEMTSKVSCMWRKMSEEDKNTFVAMAALESTHSQSDSSNLSEDLMDLKMDPFLKVTNTDDNTEFSSQETMSQEVPDLNSELTNHMEDHAFLNNETKVAESTTGDQIYTLPAHETSEVVSFSNHLNFDSQLVPGGQDMDTEIIEIESQTLSSPGKIDYNNVDELELFALSYNHKTPSPDIVEEFVDQDWNSQIVPDFDLSSLGDGI